jgi:dTDP-glucose 4,6-dehydratase
MKNLLLGKPVIAHCKKNPDGVITDISSRCWLHARNHADALRFLLENGSAGERYNVTGERYTVTEMINFISQYMNVVPEIIFEDFHSFRKGHDMHYGLDGIKLASMGWKAPVDFFDSLQRTVDWTMERPVWLGQ